MSDLAGDMQKLVADLTQSLGTNGEYPLNNPNVVKNIKVDREEIAGIAKDLHSFDIDAIPAGKVDHSTVPREVAEREINGQRSIIAALRGSDIGPTVSDKPKYELSEAEFSDQIHRGGTSATPSIDDSEVDYEKTTPPTGNGVYPIDEEDFN